MDDPLNRAFAEAAPRRKQAPPHDVSEHRTQHLRDLGHELEALRAQLLTTMASPFFDGGAQADIIPVIKHLAAELGTVKVVARKSVPAYEAVASVEIRSERDQADVDHDGGRYHVRAKLAMTGADALGHARSELVFAVHEVDGRLHVDATDLQEKIAQAIREVGAPG
jgi:hypothetical protein